MIVNKILKHIKQGTLFSWIFKKRSLWGKTGFYRIIKRKKYELFKTLIAQNEKNKAIDVGKQLLDGNPGDQILRKRLSNLYWSMGKKGKCISTMRAGFSRELNAKIDSIIPSIQKAITSDSSSIDFKFRNQSTGTNMVCWIEHTCRLGQDTRKYLTKIYKAGSNKEKLFYKKIRERHSILKSITPKFINFIEIQPDNVSLLTMEKVMEKQKNINEEYFNSIFKVHKIITSIRYNDIIDLIPQDDFNPKTLQVAYNKISLKQAFAVIHRESTNREIFNQLYNKLRRLNYSPDTIELIRRLEYMIIDRKMYEKLKPELHYTFLHGDFNRSNILIDNVGHYKVIDWSNLMIGPVGLDMVQFFKAFDFSFREIYKLYLTNVYCESYLETIEKIFFIYALIIIVWFQKLNRNTIDTQNYKYLVPAIKYIETLVSEIEK